MENDLSTFSIIQAPIITILPTSPTGAIPSFVVGSILALAIMVIPIVVTTPTLTIITVPVVPMLPMLPA